MNINYSYNEMCEFDNNPLDKELNLILQERLIKFKNDFGFIDNYSNDQSSSICNEKTKNETLSIRLWKSLSLSPDKKVHNYLREYRYLKLSEVIAQISDYKHIFRRIIDKDKTKYFHNKKTAKIEGSFVPYICQSKNTTNLENRANKKLQDSIEIRNREQQAKSDIPSFCSSKRLKIKTPSSLYPIDNCTSYNQSTCDNYLSKSFGDRSAKSKRAKSKSTYLLIDAYITPTKKMISNTEFNGTNSHLGVKSALQSLFGEL